MLDGLVSMTMLAYSSKRPLLCIWSAMGPTLPASLTLKSRVSTALEPTGCATAMRAMPVEASTTISTRLHSLGLNLG